VPLRLVGSEMCIRDRFECFEQASKQSRSGGGTRLRLKSQKTEKRLQEGRARY
jgi:hypothetical protein